MKTDISPKPDVRKRTGRKILKWLLVIVAILIVLVFLLTPVFVSSEKCRRIILAKINKSVAGRTDFADLSMGWRKGIKVADLSFDDSAGQISVRVKQIATKPHYVSLLTGNLSFGETIVDQPKVQINLKEQRPERPQQAPPSAKPQPFVLPVKNIDLVVKDGDFKVTDTKARTVQLSQINSTVNLRPPGQPTSFNVSTTVAGKDEKSKINAAGSITPQAAKTGWSFKETSGNLTVEITDLDLQSLTPLFTLAKLEASAKGTVSASLKSNIKDGQLENLNGIVNAKNLDITAPQLKGDRLQTSALNVSANLNHAKEAINIDKLQLKTDWANLSATGTVPTTLKSLSDFLQPGSNYALKGAFDCDLPAILSQMPKTLGLKEGTKISSGKLSGTVETLSGAGKKQIQANATLTGLQGQLEGKKIALSQPVNAQAVVSSDKAGITFDKLDILSSFAKVTCTGSASGEQSKIRTQLLKFDADVDLAKFQSELGQFANLGPYQMAGQLTGTGQVSLKENKIAASGSSTAKNLRLSSKEAAAAPPIDADINYAFDIDRQNDIAAITLLKANTTLGQLNIKDAVLPIGAKAAKPMRLTVAATSLDLQKLQPFAVLLASFPRELQMAGIVDSTASVTSQNDIYTIATDSTKIKNLSLASQKGELFKQSEVSLALDAQLNPKQKTINLKKLQLISPQIKIHKAELTEVAKAGKTQLTGRLDCEYDWAVLNPYLMPVGLTVKGTNKLPIELSSEYPTGRREKLLDNLSTKGTLGFTQADYRGLVFDHTEAQIQIQKGLFTILPFSTKVNNGNFYFAGQGDFKQKPTVLQTPKPMQMMTDIQINDQVAAGLLKYVNPIFANAIHVNGIANLGCERLAIPLFGKPEGDIQIIGTISVNKLHLQVDEWLNQILSLIGIQISGKDITVHPTRFVLQKRILTYDDMQIDFGDNPFNFKGAIGFDKSLNMTIVLPYTIDGKTVRVGQESVAQRVIIPLKGSLDKPEIDLKRLLQDQIKQKLLEGLDKLLKNN